MKLGIKYGYLFDYVTVSAFTEKNLTWFGRVIHALHIVRLVDKHHWAYKQQKEAREQEEREKRGV